MPAKQSRTRDTPVGGAVPREIGESSINDRDWEEHGTLLSDSASRAASTAIPPRVSPSKLDKRLVRIYSQPKETAQTHFVDPSCRGAISIAMDSISRNGVQQVVHEGVQIVIAFRILTRIGVQQIVKIDRFERLSSERDFCRERRCSKQHQRVNRNIDAFGAVTLTLLQSTTRQPSFAS